MNLTTSTVPCTKSPSISKPSGAMKSAWTHPPHKSLSNRMKNRMRMITSIACFKIRKPSFHVFIEIGLLIASGVFVYFYLLREKKVLYSSSFCKKFIISLCLPFKLHLHTHNKGKSWHRHSRKSFSTPKSVT